MRLNGWFLVEALEFWCYIMDKLAEYWWTVWETEYLNSWQEDWNISMIPRASKMNNSFTYESLFQWEEFIIPILCNIKSLKKLLLISQQYLIYTFFICLIHYIDQNTKVDKNLVLNEEVYIICRKTLFSSEVNNSSSSHYKLSIKF